MKLLSLWDRRAGNTGAGNGVCRLGQSAIVLRTCAVCTVFVLGWTVVLPFTGFSQQIRMVIDGKIRSGAAHITPATRVRILHADSTVDKTLQFYDVQGRRFGVRLSSSDGFAEGEEILFRVITPQDSFMARIAGGPLLFKGIHGPMAPPTTRVELFRNSLPVVYRSLHDTTINEKQLLRCILVAIDPDDDRVRYNLSGAPQGATIDAQTGMFSWTPSFDQAGVYRIRFLISDGYETDKSQNAVVTVKNVDRPPQFIREMPDTTIREGDTLRYTILAEDPDGDKVTYYGSGDGIPGLKLDSLSGEFRWIPDYDQSGVYSLRFLATDGTLADTSRAERITVLDVDRPPAFVSVLPDTTISEDQELRFQWKGSDPDGDSVWYQLRSGPAGLTLSTEGILTWRPSFSQAARYKLSVSLHSKWLVIDTVANIVVLNKDRPPQPFHLSAPRQDDTLRIVLPTPVRFTWSKAVDPDGDDTLRYTLRLWGSKFDTAIESWTDTTVLLGIKQSLQPLSSYHWSASVSDGTVHVSSADTFSFSTSAGITGAAELISRIPRTFDLEESYPDPFNPVTKIRYSLPERSYVRLTIFNMLGESILVLVSGEKDAGAYDVTFDASDFASGAYMYRLDAHPLAGSQTKDYINTKKMFIVR